MTTERNIAEAKNAAGQVKAELGQCKIDRDAFESYVQQINAGTWDPTVNVLPKEGPLSVRQAASISVIIPENGAYPQVFARPEIWHLAGIRLQDLQAQCKDLQDQYNSKEKTLQEITNSYNASVDLAKELASNDPSVIAARDNVEAAKIVSQTDLKKQEADAKTRKENIRTIVGAAVAIVFVVIFLKAVKIF